jgi:hypothetical protein
MKSDRAVTDDTFRDHSAYHQRMIARRNVPPAIVQAWETLNDELELRHLPPYPPPWAFVEFGGPLSETPCFPHQVGFFPQPIDPDDMAELRLLLLT